MDRYYNFCGRVSVFAADILRKLFHLLIRRLLIDASNFA